MCERAAININKVKMQNHIYHETIRNFRIEDNILIGQELPIRTEPINVSEVLLNTMKGNPDCIGEVDAVTGKKYTYADMSERSIKCALWLKKQGVKPGDIIGLCSDDNLDTILIMLGTMYIGAISNTWDYTLSPMTARYFLSLTSPTITFASSSVAPILTEAAKELGMNMKIVILDKLVGYDTFEDILKEHDTRDIAEFKCVAISKPNDVALIVLSSGTTGMPKATEISHFSLYHCLPAEKVAEMEGHICMWLPTLRWHYGVQLAFEVILACSTRIVAPYCNDEESYYEFIEKHKVTWFATIPCVLINSFKLNLLDKYRLLTLKEVGVTGSHFGAEFQETLCNYLPQALILNGYGTTDSAGDICVQIKGCKLGSNGFVVPNVRIKITDTKTGKTLGANETGELRVKLPSVMNGYYKNPEATKRAFDSDGWLCTGDLGYYDKDGEVFLIDRISEFINFRGINVSPAEIEHVLGTHPAVLHVAVIGIPHEIDEQHPMAIVSPVPGKTITEEELITIVERDLPDYCKLRAGIKILDQLPRTDTGKIAKKKLREMFAR